MISWALLLTSIAALSATVLFPTDTPRTTKATRIPRTTSTTSNNDSIIADTEPVCNNFHLNLTGGMIIQATQPQTFDFDLSNLLDWSKGNVRDCISNVSLLQTMSGLNKTVVIENIPGDKLNPTLNITHVNFDECQGGLEFSIKFFLSNTSEVISNTATYQPKFINSSEPWPSICKLTKDHGRAHHTVIYLNTFKGINPVLLHCIKSMILHEINQEEETEDHKSTLEDPEDEDKDKKYLPEDDTSKIRLEYFHDINSTMQVRGLVRKYELDDLPQCPDLPTEATVAPVPKRKKIQKSGKYIFIVLGIVLVLAVIVFFTRIYYSRKTLKRAASAKYKADSIARESARASAKTSPRESTEAVLVDI